MRIDLLAVGRMKSGAYKDLFEEYAKRMQWPLRLVEVESKHTDPVLQQQEECARLMGYLKPGAHLVCLDERGDSLRSVEFSNLIGRSREEGATYLQFVIGGANGLTDPLRKKADTLLSFGRQTWPHMLARVMLAEQIYRAQQILQGHPYHREG